MMSKRAVQRSLDNTWEDQLRYEIRAIEICRKAVNDAREQRQSFVEKRPARYTGT